MTDAVIWLTFYVLGVVSTLLTDRRPRRSQAICRHCYCPIYYHYEDHTWATRLKDCNGVDRPHEPLR